MRLGAWIAALALTLGCAACGVAPASRPQPALRGHVAPGVRVSGRSVGGMTPADAERVIGALAAETDRMPRDAYVDPSTHGLIPGVAGSRLDISATLREVLAAPRNTEAHPVITSLAPAVNLADLPPAPIYRAAASRPEIAFVINVAWGEQYLPGMLQTLAAQRAPATFCLVGRWAESHADLVREMVAIGRRADTPYAFCNHGYRDHGWALLSQADAYASITSADRVIASLTGSRPLYFSPHRGEFNPAVLAASRQSGHELVLWSLDTIDWKHPSPRAMQLRILGRVRPGDIILMHPTAVTAQALPNMIAGIRAKGLRLVTLNQLLSAQWPPSGMAATPPGANG